MDLVSGVPSADEGLNMLFETALDVKNAELGCHRISESVRGCEVEVLRLLSELGLVEWGGEEFAD
jgi:hypothetical protein